MGDKTYKRALQFTKEALYNEYACEKGGKMKADCILSTFKLKAKECDHYKERALKAEEKLQQLQESLNKILQEEF